MTDDEAKERAEDVRVIAAAARESEVGAGLSASWLGSVCEDAARQRALERWPQAIADRDKAEAELAFRRSNHEHVVLPEIGAARDRAELAEHRAVAAEALLADAVALLRRWRKLYPGTPPTGGGVWGETDALLARIDGEG